MEKSNVQCANMDNNQDNKFEELQGNLLPLITSNPTWLTYSIKDRVCLYRIDISDVPTLVVSICVNRDMSVQVFKDKSDVNFSNLSSILGDSDKIQDLSQLSTLLSYYTDAECQNIKSSPKTTGMNGINNNTNNIDPSINDFTIAVCYNFADFPTNNNSQSPMEMESEQSVVNSNGDLHDAESPRSTPASDGASYSKPCPLSFKRKRTDDSSEICINAESENTTEERKDSDAFSDNVAESSASNAYRIDRLKEICHSAQRKLKRGSDASELESDSNSSNHENHRERSSQRSPESTSDMTETESKESMEEQVSQNNVTALKSTSSKSNIGNLASHGHNQPAHIPGTDESGVRCERMLNHVLMALHNMEEQLKVKSALLDSLLSGNSLEILPRGVPDYLHLPMSSLDELDQAERDLAGKDEDKQRLAAELADIGGRDLDDLIRRVMRALLTNELAMHFNLTGQKGKKRFMGLNLCQAVFDAVKLNLLTKDATKRDIELNLAKWFTSARDRKGGLRRVNLIKQTS